MDHQPISEFPPETTLADFVQVLIRRWPVIVGLILLALLGGVGVVFSQSGKAAAFPYRAVLEVGSFGGELLEPRETVIQKMKNVYIATALKEHALANGYQEERYRVELLAPENSTMLIMETKAGSADEEALKTILGRTSTMFLEDHARILAVRKRELESQLLAAEEQHNQAQNALARAQGEKLRAEEELERLKEEATSVTTVQKERLDESERLVKQQRDALQITITESEKNRTAFLAGRSAQNQVDGSTAATLLLIDNGLQENRNRLAELEEQFAIGIKDKRNTLDQAFFNNRRAQVNQQILINNSQLTINDAQFSINKAQRALEEVQFKIDNLKATKLVVSPSRFLGERKLQLKPLNIMILSGLIGLFLGVVAAFATELFSKVRQEMKVQVARR